MQIYKKVLTIAGSDSGGGAGIQADLKTFAACGCYGMSAITAITAQNTCGVKSIHPIPVTILEDQIRMVLDDIGSDAIKIGMLHSTECIETVSRLLREYECPKVVVDPVMVASSGDALIEKDAVEALKEHLLPLATLITPNLPEMELLSQCQITNSEELQGTGNKLKKIYKTSVLAKGGHLQEKSMTDYLCAQDDNESTLFTFRHLTTRNTHGTGCTLSSAIAAHLALGYSLKESVSQAETYLHGALERGADYELGKGHGPVHHFHALWQR